MRKLYIFDTTLRDGEQSLGITLNVKEKLAISRQLVKLGVDCIEAGFPASSPGDAESVRTIARQIKGVSICGLTRAVAKDIDVCAEALRDAEQPRIHTGIAVSPLHMEKKLRQSPQQVLETAVAAVKHAKKYVSDVEFYAEDCTRSEPDFLVNVLEGVIDAGATVVNIPDTVGYATPWNYEQFVTYVLTHVKNIDRAIVSIHCHNDLGMATANSLAGIKAGAAQVEGTINGIGERAGNTSLEEVIMAIYSQRSSYGIDLSRIKTKEIAATSRLVSQITGVAIPSHKAIVGANAFMHASGIHQDGVLKSRDTYEIIDPEIVGIPRNMIVLSARSGRHALQHRLEELGYKVLTEDTEEIYKSFLKLADQKGEIFDEDLHVLMGNTAVKYNNIHMIDFTINTDGETASASVTMEVNGAVYSDTSAGNGPIDAIMKAVDRIVGLPVYLEDYSLKSVSHGSKALGDATVKIKYNNSLIIGKGISTNIFEASALAYVNALSKAQNM